MKNKKEEKQREIEKRIMELEQKRNTFLELADSITNDIELLRAGKNNIESDFIHVID